MGWRRSRRGKGGPGSEGQAGSMGRHVGPQAERHKETDRTAPATHSTLHWLLVAGSQHRVRELMEQGERRGRQTKPRSHLHPLTNTVCSCSRAAPRQVPRSCRPPCQPTPPLPPTMSPLTPCACLPPRPAPVRLHHPLTLHHKLLVQAGEGDACWGQLPLLQVGQELCRAGADAAQRAQHGAAHHRQVPGGALRPHLHTEATQGS